MAVIDRPSIQKIAFGVRYDPQWAVTDRKGAIIDQILRSRDTPFGPETFPLSQRADDSHVLLNVETKESLRFSERDMILEMMIKRDLDQVSELADKFAKYALRPLQNVGKTSNINRHGVLFILEECRAYLSESPVSHFLHQDFEHPRSLNLRFTRRLGVMEAVAKKRVHDYRNVIYQINQSDNGEVKISVDYQEYFDPVLDEKEWRETPFPRFVEQAIDYFNGEFQNWLRKMMSEDKAA